MSTENIVFEIKNFNLAAFKKLIEQSLNVDKQLILEFSNEFIRGASLSASKTFIKFWTIPITKMIVVEDEEPVENEITEVVDLTPKTKKVPEISFTEPFDFYVDRGEIFKKFMSIYNKIAVDVRFTCIRTSSGKLQASEINIKSQMSESSSVISTTYILSTDEIITNKITDYSNIITQLTPDKTMFEFSLYDAQIGEIRRLIKTLHKTTPKNTSYLTFRIDTEEKTVSVSDKVFDIAFPLEKLPSENIEFSVLKNDFFMLGVKNISIFVDNNQAKIIFGSNFGGAIVWSSATKVTDISISDNNAFESNLEETIDSLDIDEYLDL